LPGNGSSLSRGTGRAASTEYIDRQMQHFIKSAYYDRNRMPPLYKGVFSGYYFSPGLVSGLPSPVLSSPLNWYEITGDYRYQSSATGENFIIERGFFTYGVGSSRFTRDSAIYKEYFQPSYSKELFLAKDFLYVCLQSRVAGLPADERYIVRRHVVRPWYLCKNEYHRQNPFVFKKKYDEYEVFYKYQ
jgi:hypothetical protein